MPIFKAAENKKGGGKGGFKTSPKYTLDYITRPDKAAIVSSFYLTDSEDYADQFADTKKVWNKAQSKSSRQYYHFIHSFASYDDITPELAHELTEKLIKESFPNSEAVIATHTDTGHVHCHVVLNSVEFDTGKMLQISPKAYTAIKDLSNELAAEHGLTPVNFRKPSSEPVRQSQAERQIIMRGGTSWKQELCEVIDYAMQNSSDMDEFQNILSQYGVEITRNTEKTIAYKHPQKAKAIRGEKLGQNYTKEAIKNVLDQYKNRADSYAGLEFIGGEYGHSQSGYSDLFDVDYDWRDEERDNREGSGDTESDFGERGESGDDLELERAAERQREIERKRRAAAWEH